LRALGRFAWKLLQFAGLFVAFNGLAGLIMFGIQQIYGQLNLSPIMWVGLGVVAASIVVAVFTTPEETND